jgi:hypothetical protein
MRGGEQFLLLFGGNVTQKQIADGLFGKGKTATGVEV